MKSSFFPYSYWLKWIGWLILISRIITVYLKYLDDGIFDLNNLAMGFCLGLFFIFFSEEKADDEMIHSLKYKALITAVIVGFSAMHLYNYIYLNKGLKRGHGIVQSISAYQFLALTLILATGIFYFLRYRAVNPKPE